MNSQGNMVGLQLPKELIELQELKVCSNILKTGVNIVQFEGQIPIVIGSGAYPMVWLKARSNEKEWIDIVAKSESLHPALGIIKSSSSRELSIVTGNIVILHAKMNSDSTCTVDLIDLRPCGINLHGTESVLEIAGSKFERNTFQSIKFMVGLQ